MPTNLYDVLQVTVEATPEEIRNAYRKRALGTHPDRLPPGATEEQIQRSNDQFRQVNKAYQVLSDPRRRREYDRKDVLPPPQPTRDATRPSRRQEPRPSRQQQPIFDSLYRDVDPDPFSHPFFSTSRMPFADPFEFFEQFFPEARGMHARASSSSSMMPRDPFSMMRNNMRSMVNDMRDVQSTVASASIGSSFGSGRSSGSTWVSSSQQSFTVNGVTQSITKQRDSQGNEHVKTVGPDGRGTYTINGVVQNAPLSVGPQGQHRQIRSRAEEDPPPPYARNRHSSTSRASTKAQGHSASRESEEESARRRRERRDRR